MSRPTKIKNTNKSARSRLKKFVATCDDGTIFQADTEPDLHRQIREYKEYRKRIEAEAKATKSRKVVIKEFASQYDNEGR